jgi:hypothetical protein
MYNMCDDNEKKKKACFYYNIDFTLGKRNEQTTPKTKKIICS